MITERSANRKRPARKVFVSSGSLSRRSFSNVHFGSVTCRRATLTTRSLGPVKVERDDPAGVDLFKQPLSIDPFKESALGVRTTDVLHFFA